MLGVERATCGPEEFEWTLEFYFCSPYEYSRSMKIRLDQNQFE